ncbi:hypothetical protein GCM10023142_24380 [Anaerocolumna aminovalerica]|uniref:Niacin transporter n=1 Tax=Anaerocolumna aminovalerica TaxID=1527 RepID=A0A1I5IQM0_9FIRM|nr:hypothetical protein [Anaerocolumna aminovalerica]SFO62875.1 niacin transporter [Anaerocolumna aminovalerica]
MRRQNKVQIIAIAALLCALGILIPMIAPKIVIEPASFTLASHVPVFIAMFISPAVAISVAFITGLGFLISGFPLVIVLRALSHAIFAVIGAYALKKNSNLIATGKSNFLFNLAIAIIHAISEVAIVTFFYWGSSMTSAYYDKGYLLSVVVLVGLGTVIHSMLDFTIALYVWKPVQKVVTVPISIKLSSK